MLDDFRFAWKTFKSKKLRSSLTMIGVIIGIAAIVSLISLGQGLQDGVTEQFRSMGTDKIFIMPGTQMFGATVTSAELTEDDIDVIRKVPGVKETADFMFRSGEIVFNDKTRYFFVSSFPTDRGLDVAREALGADIDEGRMFENGDARKAIVGYKLANDDTVFGREIRIGDKIEVRGMKFDVIGVFESRGNDGDDTSVFIPGKTYEDLFDQKSFDWVIIQVSDGEDQLLMAERITKRLRRFRGLEEGEEDFNVQTFDQLLDSFGVILVMINAVLIGIASISLVVGGIGITNTMFTSVLERRRDIGIMKSIGAKNSDIMRIFLIEAGLLGLTGGLLGLALGIGLAKGVQYISAVFFASPLINASIPPFLVIGSLSFSVIMGLIGGVLPAIQASKMHPVEALRK